MDKTGYMQRAWHAVHPNHFRIRPHEVFNLIASGVFTVGFTLLFTQILADWLEAEPVFHAGGIY